MFCNNFCKISIVRSNWFPSTLAALMCLTAHAAQRDPAAQVDMSEPVFERVIGESEQTAPEPTDDKPTTTETATNIGKDSSSSNSLSVIRSKNSARNSSATTKMTAPKNEELKGKKWSGNVSYRVETNWADTAEPRLYDHSLEVGGGYDFLTNWNASASISASYAVVGDQQNEIIQPEGGNEAFVSDISIGVDRKFDFSDGKQTLLIGLSNEFPTSQESQEKGYRSVVTQSNDFTMRFLNKKLSLSNALELTYIANTYQYAQGTEGKINKEGHARYNLGVKAKVWRGLSLRASAGFQVNRQTDATYDRKLRNAVGISYDWSDAFSTTLQYSNGSYADHNEIDMWYQDKYRQISSLRLAYNF